MSGRASSAGLWLEGSEGRRRHTILTPEGVLLRFRVGRAGDRLGAFVIDLVIVFGSTLLLALLAALASGGRLEGGWLWAFVILANFLLRSFYFTFFELRWQGTTPGKRRLGLRVIDRRGGPLRGEAIFARNLMREVEFFLPVAGLLEPSVIWPGATGWLYLVVSLWLLIFLLMPLLNRQRLRIGDLVAGTIVVEAPKALLLPDLSARALAEGDRFGPQPRFTTEQLEIYGIYELQVLEKLLRRDGPSDWDSLLAVAETIKRKIGWREEGPSADPEAFLRAFYAAQRARLEHRMLLGRRREDKHDREA